MTGENINVISTTINYKGIPIKISNGKVLLPQFGTTILDHSPHWSYIEIPIEKLNIELREHLQSNGFIQGVI